MVALGLAHLHESVFEFIDLNSVLSLSTNVTFLTTLHILLKILYLLLEFDRTTSATRDCRTTKVDTTCTIGHHVIRTHVTRRTSTVHHVGPRGSRTTHVSL